MTNQSARFLLIAIVVVMLPIFFQNCSSKHDPGSASAGSHSVGCGEMRALFERTYHSFTKTTCNSCHTAGGVGKGAFADGNADVAWDAFQITGFSKISEYAVNPSHNPPFTGTHNEVTISELKQKWITGLEEQQKCLNGDKGSLSGEEVGERLVTTEKLIDLSNVGDSRVISWNLKDQLIDAGVPVPEIGAGQVEVKIEVVQVLDQVAYYISEPWIRGADIDLHVEGLRTIINGSYVEGETTFAFIEKDIYANSNTILSSGTSVILGYDRTQDSIALSFGKIEPTMLPPPYKGPKVNLSKTTHQVDNEQGRVQFDVTLNESPQETVVVTLKISDKSEAKARRAERSEDEPYDHYDWDFTFGSVSEPQLIETLTFTKNGPLSKTVEVIIADDDREEGDEQAIIEMIAVENGQIDMNKILRINIKNDDKAVSNPFVATFTQLMTGNGVLKNRCLECHNTVKKEGGYDLTDYQSMTSARKSILIPGDPTNSEMFKRIRLQGPGRMPLDQSLSPLEQSQIEDWIRNGAKNN